MSAGDSAKFLAGSPYIRDLAALVVGYGMAINIVEVSETVDEHEKRLIYKVTVKLMHLLRCLVGLGGVG